MIVLPRLREMRLRRAMTQEELAKASGVSRGTIARLEAGGVAPYPSTVRKLAAALGVEPEVIMEIVERGEAAA